MECMSGAGSGAPPGAGSPVRKKGAVALQVKLACATLDAVRNRYPELRDRRFTLRTQKPYPIDTMVRLETRLSGGAPCFHATAVVEKVSGGGSDPVAMTLAIIAMDEPGRELVGAMGGKPPRSLTDAASPPAPSGAATIPDSAMPHLAPSAKAAKAAATDAADTAGVDEGAETPFDEAPAAAEVAAPEPADSAAIDWNAASPAYPVADVEPEEAAAAPSWDDAFEDSGAAIAIEPVALDGDLFAAAPEAAKPAPKAPARPGAAKPSVAPARPAASSAKAPPPATAAKAPSPPAAAQRPAPAQAPARPAPAPAAPKPAPVPAAAKPPPAPTKPAPPARPASAPPKLAGIPSQNPGSEPPPMPPPSRRPAPAPLPPPTMVKGAPAGPVQAVLVEDVVPEPPKQGAKKGRIIGIDLGTTNSAAAVVKEGKAFIIPSREGYNTNPTVVAHN
jgi:hypothetical protein